jgi:hypothetical protein
MGYYVSRQRCAKDNCLFVEIAVGGKSKAGLDILGIRYAGECKNLVDPRDAINSAERIYRAWEIDYADEKKQLKIVGQVNGPIVGSTNKPMVFDFTSKGIASARAWADKIFASMKKCGACQKAMGSRDPYEMDDMPNLVFCTEYCTARKYRDLFGVEPPRIQSTDAKKQMKALKK